MTKAEIQQKLEVMNEKAKTIGRLTTTEVYQARFLLLRLELLESEEDENEPVYAAILNQIADEHNPVNE